MKEDKKAWGWVRGRNRAWAGMGPGPELRVTLPHKSPVFPRPAAVQEQHGGHQAMSAPSPQLCSQAGGCGAGAWPQESLLAQPGTPGAQSQQTSAKGLALHRCPIIAGQMGRKSNAQSQPPLILS